MRARRCVAVATLTAIAAGAHAGRSAGATPTPTEICDDAFDKAQDFHKARKLLAERAKLLICASDACDPAIRKRCEEWIVRADDTTPTVLPLARYRGGADILDAKVWLDGAPLSRKPDGGAIPVDPGPHKLLFRVERSTDVEVSVVLVEGEKNRPVIATFEPPTTPAPAAPPETSPPRVGAFILAGVSVVALSSFAYFGLKGSKELSDIRATECAPYCEAGPVDAAERKFLIADISLGVGVLALAGSAWLFLRAGDQKPDLRVSVVPLVPEREPRGVTASS